MQISRVLPAFSVGAAVMYLASMYFHPLFTLFTYSPRTGQWYTGVPSLPGNQGPGMYWYSWLTTGFLAGVVAAAIAFVLPESLRVRIWSGWTWAVPLCLIGILTYIERTWFGFK